MYRHVIKRVLDILIALLAFPFFLLLCLVVGPLIWLEDHGPIFYNAPRLGKGGRVFKMYKFRSMYDNAPDIRNSDGSTFNSEDDPRVTKIGRVLRKTSIDEISQILNILNGDMSLIGPRPDLPDHRKLYHGEQIEKLLVRPGVTGYNQAYFRNSVEWDVRLEHDVYYVRHLTFWFDVKIFFRTIWCVLNRKNVYIVEPTAGEREEVWDKTGSSH